MENIIRSSAINVQWAKTAQYSTLLFMILIAVLHFIKPEIDPSWRMLSEYALGENGWVMVIAFLVWAISFIALFYSIRRQTNSVAGKVGLIALWVSASGLLLAAVFETDPVTINEPTTTGMLHSLGGTLGIAMPVATILLSIELYRNKSWKSSRQTIAWAGILTIVGFVVSCVSLVVLLSASEGKFGPDTPVGYPMRFEVLCYCIWMIIVSRKTIKLGETGR